MTPELLQRLDERWGSVSHEILAMMITQVGRYYLGQDILSVPGLEEFSEQEYITAEAVGMRRMLADEKFFNAEPIEFLHVPWDSLMVGSTRGRIYKLSLQFNTQNASLSKTVFKGILHSASVEMGEYSDHPFFSSKYFWDRVEGNAFLYKMNKAGWNSINLVITASFIREQADKVLKAYRGYQAISDSDDTN